MFRIKICGITNLADAIDAVVAGADAIGLNFHPKSSRNIAVNDARQIVGDLDGSAVCIGVFVNMPLGDLEQTFIHAQLNGAQLHGDESPEMVAAAAKRLQSLSVPDPLTFIRTRRIDGHDLGAIREDLDHCRNAGALLTGVLVDAALPGQYGGTGERLPWDMLADYRAWLSDTPLILAGGLTPDNVAEAIRIVRPAAVDVASGVESSPGKKDPHKVRDFVAAAQAAFESPES